MSGRDEKLRELLAADANATAMYLPLLPRPRQWPPLWVSGGLAVKSLTGNRWEFQFTEAVPFNIACFEWMLQMGLQHGGPLTFYTYAPEDLDEASIW